MTPLNFDKLTRSRADPEWDDYWQIWCGDILAGTISKANGMPNAKNCWNWSAGFYPGSHPREIRGGTADTFEEARAEFLPAWPAFARSRKPEDFEEWRDQRDWTACKYRMHDEGLPLPTQSDTGRARCFCGAEITTASVAGHIRAAHQETGA
jgi:hypothetical protein